MDWFFTFLADLWNWTLRNKEWVFSGIGVPVLTYLFFVIFKQRKRRVQIKYHLGVAFVETGSRKYLLSSYIEMSIINIGSQEIFLREPIVRVSRKIDGENTFQVITPSDRTNFPLKLIPGQEYRKKFNPLDLDNKILSKLKDGDKIRFQAKDTLGKFYQSSKIEVRKVREHLNMKFD